MLIVCSGIVMSTATSPARTFGTMMTFSGIPRAAERADLMAYLNSLADNPAPLNKGAEIPGNTRAAQAPR